MNLTGNGGGGTPQDESSTDDTGSPMSAIDRAKMWESASVSLAMFADMGTTDFMQPCPIVFSVNPCRALIVRRCERVRSLFISNRECQSVTSAYPWYMGECLGEIHDVCRRRND